MPILLDHTPLNLTSTPVVHNVQVPDTATWVKVSLTRCSATNPTLWSVITTTVRVTIELDGAAFGAFTSRGGVHVTLQGGELAETSATYPLPPTLGRDLDITVIRTSLGDPFVSDLTVESD